MRIIGFDSATDDTVVAASQEGEVTFEYRGGPGQDGRPVHSRDLLPGISEAATSLGGWQSVDRIAVGLGPGTFTGLRIAVATASGLAMSAGIEAVGVPTLEALARCLARSESAGTGAAVAAVLDARRGEVFAAAWDASGVELMAPAAVSPESAAESMAALEGPVMAGGPGALRFRDLFSAAGITVEDPGPGTGRLDGASICELGAAVTAEADHPLEAIYIREPDAKRWLERDARPPAG